MNVLLADRPGDHLHRAGAVVTPGPRPDFVHAAIPGWKQRRVPRKEPFGGERLVVVARGVEHHFDYAFDITVRGLECADIHAEPPGNRGPHLFGVQLFPLDLAALEHIGGQGLQHGFLPEGEAEGFHMAHQPALLVAGRGDRFGKLLAATGKSGPILKLMGVHSTHLLRRLYLLFDAWASIRRVWCVEYGVYSTQPQFSEPDA